MKRNQFKSLALRSKKSLDQSELKYKDIMMYSSPPRPKTRVQFSPTEKIENASYMSPIKSQTRPVSAAARVTSPVPRGGRESQDSMNFGSEIYRTELEPEYMKIDEVIELVSKAPNMPLDRWDYHMSQNTKPDSNANHIRSASGTEYASGIPNVRYSY